MYWTLELASSLDDAPWPASKEELIDYANRSGAPEEVIENLTELEDDGEIYESIEGLKTSENASEVEAVLNRLNPILGRSQEVSI